MRHKKNKSRRYRSQDIRGKKTNLRPYRTTDANIQCTKYVILTNKADEEEEPFKRPKYSDSIEQRSCDRVEDINGNGDHIGSVTSPTSLRRSVH